MHLLVEGDQIIGSCHHILIMLSGIKMVYHYRTSVMISSLTTRHLASVIISVFSEGFGLLDFTFQLGLPPGLCALNFLHRLIDNSRYHPTPKPSIL